MWRLYVQENKRDGDNFKKKKDGGKIKGKRKRK